MMIEAGEQVVEVLAELLDLVVCAVEVEPARAGMGETVRPARRLGAQL